jgi:hypothetical protein
MGTATMLAHAAHFANPRKGGLLPRNETFWRIIIKHHTWRVLFLQPNLYFAGYVVKWLKMCALMAI